MALYSTDPKLPNYARPEYIATLPDLALIANEVEGTRAMHAASKTYIRKWGGEKPANYDIRRVCETFFEGFGRTLSAAVGMLFAKAPQIEWNQAEATMAPHWDNIDGAGTKGDVFLKRFSEASLRDGLAIILVDHPSAPGQVDAEQESRLFLRPTWAMYPRVAAINWLDDKVDNQQVLTALVLAESAVVPDGAYGVKRVQQYRVLRLQALEGGVIGATWTLFEQRDAGTEVAHYSVVGAGVFRNRTGQPAPRIPVAIAYTGRSDGIMQSKIPLLGVAWANLSHWQLSTSLRFNSEVAGLAQPVVIGELAVDPTTGKATNLEIGPLVKVQLAAGGDFKWAEPQGTGLERLKVLVTEKLREIAALGVSFLSTDTRAAETAEAKRLDASAENATLATAAQAIEDAANQALEIHAWYVGIEKAGAPTVSISKDFEDNTLAADIMTAYVGAVANAGLPVRLMLDAWQQGGRIGPDVDLDELEAEMTVNQAAKDAHAEMEREAALAAAGEAA